MKQISGSLIVILTLFLLNTYPVMAGGGGDSNERHGYRCMENKLDNHVGGTWCRHKTYRPKIRFTVDKSWGIAWKRYYKSPEISFGQKNCYKSKWDKARVKVEIICSRGRNPNPSNCPGTSSDTRDSDYVMGADRHCKKK